MSGSTIIPGMRYRDAHKAIDWLVEVFGFEKQAVYDGPNWTVAHAQLTLGTGMVMLGSVENGGATSAWMTQPEEAGGKETQSAYLVVGDAAAIYARAKAAGATMLLDFETKEYGGSGFTCRDPEGHIWSVGEYDPWVPEAK